MSLSHQSHRRIFQRFDQLRDLPADAREQAINADTSLSEDERQALRSLLEHDAPTGQFLGAPIQSATASLIQPLSEERAPETLGQFRILRLLGRGSFGNVYLAEQQHPKRHVAIKVLSNRVPATEMRRLEFEAEALARLDHPNITSVLDLGRDNDRHFLVMEYVDGLPLDQFLLLHDPAPATRLRLLAGVCDGVEHAHRRGVLHRDIAPKNILVTHDRVAKILDFGLAREVSARTQASQRLTLPGSVIGTLRYMSPEQLDGDPDLVDTRSDIYSLGVVVYESLAGRHPYLDEPTTLGEAVTRLRNAEPARPVRGRLSSDLNAVLLKSVERDPQRRYTSAAELARDLRNIASNRPVSARAASWHYRIRKSCARNRTITAALALGLLMGSASVVSSAVTLKREAQSRDSAINALNAVITRLLSPLAPRIGTLDDRDVLLNEIEGDLASMMSRTPNDSRVVELFAAFQVARADIHRERDLPDLALEAYRRATEAYAHLWERSSRDPRIGHAYTLAIVKLGDTEIVRGNTGVGHDLYQLALQLDESLAEQHPTDIGLLSNLFWSYWRVASLQVTTNEGFAAYDNACADLAQRMVELDPSNWRSLEAMTHVQLRRVIRLGQSDQGVLAMVDAIAWAERLVATNPESTIHNTKLLNALASILEIAEPRVSAADHQRYVRRAAEIEAALSANQGELRLEDGVLSHINSLRAHDAIQGGRFEDATVFAEKSLEYQRRRLTGSNGSPNIALYMCGTLTELLFPAKRESDPDWSPDHERALIDQLAQEVLERFPDHPETQSVVSHLRAIQPE